MYRTFFFIACVAWAQPALTIYNQNFAVVRESVPLDLKTGSNRITHSGVTAYVEPESVALRDPSGKIAIRVLEQNYRADPISMGALLQSYEGQTIDFSIPRGEKTEVVKGRIVRAGSPSAYAPGPQFGYMNPQVMQRNQDSQPIIETDGKLRFGLPGTPMFPALAPGAILTPTLEWTLYSPASARIAAELSYVTAAMNWSADYNLTQTADGGLEVAGWVTIENNTGRRFEDARIKLMAGDVNKIVRPDLRMGTPGGVIGGVVGGVPGGLPNVTEKTFDEYHLYSLPARTTLLDKQTKQVEFVRATGVKAAIIYVYDGMKLDLNRWRGMPAEALRMDPTFGAQSTNKVWVMREFVNSKANQLGIPLPKGKTRFYRSDSDGLVEFTGEDTIDHTPEDETVRVFTGAAFDLTGERRRTMNRVDHARSTIEEAFEIKVRNRKKEQATVRIVEHLLRWNTWDIPVTSSPFVKKDSDTIEFTVVLGPGEEKGVSYSVRYTW